ncbi:MAG: hypothetical protein ACRDOI_31950 [Trebonia sp.]
MSGLPPAPTALERRERFARKHPEVKITGRFEAGRRLFEVSEPGRPAAAYEDAGTMMDDLEKRYPD